MLTAYFDESCGKGFTVICGWIAAVDEWDNFEVDWKLFLINYDVPYFHMKEFAQSTGPFAKWKATPNFRKRFLRDAWDIIRSRSRGGFACYVQDVLFNRTNRSYWLREKFPSHYALVGRECIRWAHDYARDICEEVRCIFDDGGPNKNELLGSVNIKPQLPNPTFEPSRDIPDRKRGIRKGVVQIQAADFLAYEVRKYIVDHPLIRSGRRLPRAPLWMFGQRRPDTKFFNEQRFVDHCHEFGIEKRIANY
ncbi:MAG: DUF3800 domain-containing protein [Candidatus Acidiferrales bacterium]